MCQIDLLSLGPGLGPGKPQGWWRELCQGQLLRGGVPGEKGRVCLKGRGHQQLSSAEGFVWWTKSEVRLEEVPARGYLCTTGPKA